MVDPITPSTIHWTDVPDEDFPAAPTLTLLFPAQPTSPTLKPSVPQITERDKIILKAMVDVRAITVPLLHNYCFPSARHSTTVFNWLRRMKALELVTSRSKATPRGRSVYLPTHQAHALVGDVSGPGKPVGEATLSHTLSVAEVFLEASRHATVTVVPEREINRAYAVAAVQMKMRTTQRPVPPPPGVWWSSRRRGALTHKPDLVIENPTSGRRKFVEVELSSKEPPYLKDILEGFVEAIDRGTLHAVRYLGPETVVRRVQSVAAKLTTDAQAQAAFSFAIYKPKWDT